MNELKDLARDTLAVFHPWEWLVITVVILTVFYLVYKFAIYFLLAVVTIAETVVYIVEVYQTNKFMKRYNGVDEGVDD